MEHLVLHIIKLLFSLFREDIKNEQIKNFRSIHYDQNTKISILKDQFKIYFSAKNIDEKLKSEEYIFKIINELKSDFEGDENKIQLLDDIVFEIRYNSDTKKNIQRLLHNL